MISRLRYTLREMWASLTRNLTLTVAAVITSMVSLFLFGITLLIQQAFDNQLSQWTGGVQMVVYVNHGAQPEAVRDDQRGTGEPPGADQERRVLPGRLFAGAGQEAVRRRSGVAEVPLRGERPVVLQPSSRSTRTRSNSC